MCWLWTPQEITCQESYQGGAHITGGISSIIICPKGTHFYSGLTKFWGSEVENGYQSTYPVSQKWLGQSPQGATKWNVQPLVKTIQGSTFSIASAFIFLLAWGLPFPRLPLFIAILCILTEHIFIVNNGTAIYSFIIDRFCTSAAWVHFMKNQWYIVSFGI